MVPPAGSYIKPAWEPEALAISLKQVLDGGKGVIPEYIAKWISGHGMPSSFLCLGAGDGDAVETISSPSPADVVSAKSQRSSLSGMKCRSMSLSANPVVKELQDLQRRLPLTLSSDVLMANCAWEFLVIWNRDSEVIYALEQAIVYLKCVQNAVLQHGLALMIWQMFVVKKLSSAALLVDKVGKAPKDRLCRKEVGLSEVSLEKFIGHTVDLLETIAQARLDMHEMPMFIVEDVWQNIQGPTSLVELAVEQNKANTELVEHHYMLCVLLHAALVFGMKSIKPLSLFDTKGKNAFFKPLHSVPLLNYEVADDVIIGARKQFLCRVITQSVIASMADSSDDHHSTTASHIASSSPSSSPSASVHHPLPYGSSSLSTLHSSLSHAKWPQLVLKLAVPLGVDSDDLVRHHVLELYSCGQDKLAQEVLLTVSNHALIGSDLLAIAGCRLAHFVYNCDPPNGVERLAKCSPAVSSWLQSLDVRRLRCPSPPLKITALLLGHVVNQLPEGHSEYKLALELVELVQSFL
jgi:hypothetical protein